MEMRHLRYFVAVAEEGSLTVAAERRLNTAQPSLSRQIRDLEEEVGVPLLRRTSKGVELTEAGKVFLDYARLALAQAESAREAARQAGGIRRGVLRIGFLTGQEMTWLSRVTEVMREVLPHVEVSVSSQISPALADQVAKGTLDLAFMRREASAPDLLYKVMSREPIVVVLPADHHLAAQSEIEPHQIVGETLIGTGPVAPVLRATVDDYWRRVGIEIVPTHDVDDLAMAISLIASTRGVGLAPIYLEKLLPPTLTTRPLKGEPPSIELVIGYHRANRSQDLKRFLAGMEKAVAGEADRELRERPRD